MPVDTPCGHCGHSGGIHFKDAEPETLTGQTSGCLYHDSEGDCECPGWVPEESA